MTRRLALIGLDAADLDFVRSHRASLPFLGEALCGSSVRRLASTAGVMPGSVWPTFFTGTLPGNHGVYHHLQWDPASMRLRRVTRDWPATTPFWVELDRRGVRVLSVDVPMSFPSALASGVEVVNWGSHDTLGGFETSPASLGGEIGRRFGTHPMGCEIPVQKTRSELTRVRDALIAGARRKGELLGWLAEKTGWDLFIGVFGETHRGGHLLWPEGPGENAVPPDALLDVLRALDAAAGSLAGRLARSGAEVYVFSLHGMGPNRSQEHFVPPVMDRLNAAFAGGRKTAAPARAGVQRSPARYLREHLPAGLQNAIAHAVPMWVRDAVVDRSITGGRDWATTPGLAQLADLNGYLKLNVAGRERDGRLVAGSDELGRYRHFLVDGFQDLRIEATGEALVGDVIETPRVFPGPRADLLPDLVVSWSGAPPAERVTSETLGCVEARIGTGRTGNHRSPGFLAACGPREGSDDLLAAGHIAHLARLISARFDGS